MSSPLPGQADLIDEARRLASLLERLGRKVVFAESCTGGLVSATLTRVSGISDYHCGSSVVYRPETKSAWLGLDLDLLHREGTVRESVAREMAEAVLAKTPEADVAATVTGHLGPDAPPDLDGLIYIGLATTDRLPGATQPRTTVKERRLGVERSDDPDSATGLSLRERRQAAAAKLVLAETRKLLESLPPDI